jgi:response regulator RpfG family c-di-GMP phosphodiesterase
LYMPQVNGWKFLEKVELIHPHLSKPVRIYILSSSINPRDIEYARQFSCVQSFIFKPITKEVLEKLVNEEVSKAR